MDLSVTFFNALKAMYESVCVYMRVFLQYTIQSFLLVRLDWSRGVYSARDFFSMFVNEIAVELSNVWHDIQLQSGMIELFLLLSADELALLNSTESA